MPRKNLLKGSFRHLLLNIKEENALSVTFG